MDTDGNCFVEWKEQYVSKERGNRVVHYFLKDNFGDSILAVVGTERSVRHMFYVVSEEFLSVHGTKNSVHTGFRWRSRREVVNWLTSMLTKQHKQCDYALSPRDEPTAHQNLVITPKGYLARNVKTQQLDIKWSGISWTCGKQLKHYPAFCRNGVSIAVQSFVFVMAERENQYVSYLEDMYEDRKCQKKIKVRWFHRNKEVVGVVSLCNPHPKEVFITPYVQVISAECVDGPAIVLTRDHYDKCLSVFPNDLLKRMHFCNRQYKSNRVKPFKLTNLRGYFDQPIFSCFSPDFFEEEFSSDDDVKVGFKRNRSFREHQKMIHELSYQKVKCDVLNNDQSFLKHIEGNTRCTPCFGLKDKVEILCQDSGIRGCWFQCSVLEISKRQMKILYNDVKEDDSCTNLEEWIPTYRVAKADKLGIRHPGRPTVRPVYVPSQRSLAFEVGDPVDAWWSDGWWEGVVSGTEDRKNYKVYISGENMHLTVDLKNLRVSREWISGRWLDIVPSPNILDIIYASRVDTKLLKSSAVSPSTKSDNSPISCQKVVTKNTAVLEEIDDLAGMTLTNVPLKDGYISDEHQQLAEAKSKENYTDHLLHEFVEEKDNIDRDLVDAVVKVDEANCFGVKFDGNKVNEVTETSNEDATMVGLQTDELKTELETIEI